MKTIQTEIEHFYTLIVEQENESNVAHCRIIVTGTNRVIKDRISFNGNDFDNHVKWAQKCANDDQRKLIASKAFNLN